MLMKDNELKKIVKKSIVVTFLNDSDNKQKINNKREFSERKKLSAPQFGVKKHPLAKS